MRLVCPNCDAEYEVDAAAIPDGGRDVQCSNCGHAWFQLPPEVEAELAAEEALFDAPPSLEALSTAPGLAADLSAPELAEQAPPDHAAAPRAAVSPDPGQAPPPQPEPALRSIDESVLAVLREEAEREVKARQVEAPVAPAPVMETQSELGLEAPVSGMAAVARRLARLKGEPEAVVKPQTRRDMLPEIEEINSTLRASSEKRAGASAAIAETLDAEHAQKSGFRSGFALMLILAVALLAAYVMAPKLAQQFPAAAGALQAYVAVVDAARLSLDGLLKSAMGFLKGLAGGQA